MADQIQPLTFATESASSSPVSEVELYRLRVPDPVSEEEPEEKQRQEWEEWKEWKEWRKLREERERWSESPPKRMAARTNISSRAQDQPEHPTGHEESSEDNVKYVLSGQPTGWSAMAREVRNFDEEKIRDCKEDIDTLLVIAGLFSGVLTAFIIESYSRLQADPTNDMAQSLRQIVAQTASYRLDGGLLNSTVTTPPPSIERFEPTSADIRVNVLWFASLLFSLTTASFSILVKQWLREYLATENPSPQARLRLRHLRYPALATWQVFEISALLPMLLQLSIGLFFVGLCYFTAAVHSSVGHTTIPIVAGWAFCFFAAALLPVFFPRCPYRSRLFQPVVSGCQRSLKHIAYKVNIGCEHLQNGARWAVTTASLLGPMSELVLRQYDTVDEKTVIQDPDNDVEILVAVDAIQSSDEMLGTTIKEALIQLERTHDDVLAFVQCAMHSRLQSVQDEFSPWEPFLIFALHELNDRAKACVIDIIHQHLNSIEAIEIPLDVSAFRSLIVLSTVVLWRSGRSLSSCILETISTNLRVTDECAIAIYSVIQSLARDDTKLKMFLEGLADVFARADAKCQSWVLANILATSRTSSVSMIFQDPMAMNVALGMNQTTIVQLLESGTLQYRVSCVSYIDNLCQKISPNQEVWRSRGQFEDMLVAFIYEIVEHPILSASSYLTTICAQILAHRPSTSAWISALGRASSARILKLMNELLDLFLTYPTCDEDWVEPIANFHEATVQNVVLPSPGVSGATALHVCCFAVCMTYHFDRSIDAWRPIFANMADILFRTWFPPAGVDMSLGGQEDPSGVPELAVTCLQLIGKRELELRDSDDDNHGWEHLGPRERFLSWSDPTSMRSVYGTALVHVLDLFTTDARFAEHWDSPKVAEWRSDDATTCDPPQRTAGEDTAELDITSLEAAPPYSSDGMSCISIVTSNGS